MEHWIDEPYYTHIDINHAHLDKYTIKADYNIISAF